MGLVLVDLDGTLLASRSSERLFIAHLAKQGLLGPRQVSAATSFLLRHIPRFGLRAVKLNKAYLDGHSVAEMEDLAETFVDHAILPRLRGAMFQRLKSHSRRGDRLALLSGAPDFIIGPLAVRLDIPLWRATRPAREAGRYRAAIPESHPFAGEKVAAAVELSRAADTSLADSTAYANSIHDVALMERVRRPVAVNPDRRLRRLAERRGWEILGETYVTAAVAFPNQDNPLAN